MSIQFQSEAHAKACFDNDSKRKKIKASYEELKFLFESDITIANISRRFNVTRQGLHLIYQKYFAPFMGTGRERQASLTESRNAGRIWWDIEHNPKLSYVVNEADRQGFEVYPIQQRGPDKRKAYDNMLAINDKVCLIHYKPNSYRATYTEYYRLIVSRQVLSGTDFLIVTIGLSARRKLYILPSEMITDLIGARKFKFFYIPVRPALDRHRGPEPMIDWESFENGWDQLR